jgi:hypothetical protein
MYIITCQLALFEQIDSQFYAPFMAINQQLANKGIIESCENKSRKIRVAAVSNRKQCLERIAAVKPGTVIVQPING